MDKVGDMSLGSTTQTDSDKLFNEHITTGHSKKSRNSHYQHSLLQKNKNVATLLYSNLDSTCVLDFDLSISCVVKQTHSGWSHF